MESCIIPVIGFRLTTWDNHSRIRFLTKHTCILLRISPWGCVIPFLCKRMTRLMLPMLPEHIHLQRHMPGLVVNNRCNSNNNVPFSLLQSQHNPQFHIPRHLLQTHPQLNEGVPNHPTLKATPNRTKNKISTLVHRPINSPQKKTFGGPPDRES